MGTNHHCPLTRRPLGEATRRVNNSQSQSPIRQLKSVQIPQDESQKPDGLLQARFNTDMRTNQDYHHHGSSGQYAANPRLSAIVKDSDRTTGNRNSIISTASTNSRGKLKSYIGPWKLGKTLGRGSTARVRLARHKYTGQEAAVKIVQKANAQMSQAGSLASFEQAESSRPDVDDGLRRMPAGIEREVAIMKLIQHPNIMKLYDIWENRKEIYLCLEYVDNGELFELIAQRGRLEEEEAMRYFRQILSAVGYCHSYNICHRDLKPENILLTSDGQIKIADFGMAALHQGPDHKLSTSCGSPHYAAPELIKGAKYRGNMVDIWSMGVILYATLAGRLPFDVEGATKEWLTPLLSKIKKGHYEMVADFSPEVKSLIRKMLQTNPEDRITLSQIWKHPLIKKYDYLDDLGRGIYPQSPSSRECGRPVVRRSDVNKEIFRHLRSMWYTLSEQQLMKALLSEEPNEQKLFYTLLIRFRDAQLENYIPDIRYSASDYHHVKPLNLTKTYSTCHFPKPQLKGHGRQISKFTVISNAAETERSYDPFKASQPQLLSGRNDKVNITVYQHDESSRDKRSPVSTASFRQASSASSVAAAHRLNQNIHLPPKYYTSRSSLASSTRSRNSRVRASIGKKRGVSFNHLRRSSLSERRSTSTDSPVFSRYERHSNHTEVTDDGGDFIRPITAAPEYTQHIQPKKARPTNLQPLLSANKNCHLSQLFNEDVRLHSSSLAKDCDEAFNRSSAILRTSRPTSAKDAPKTTKGQKTKISSLETRPLPLPPVRTDSLNIELLEARKQAKLRMTWSKDESTTYLDKIVTHIDCLIQPPSPPCPAVERRAISAPVDTRHLSLVHPLPSIYENKSEEASSDKVYKPLLEYENLRGVTNNGRIASAPESRPTRSDRFTPASSCTRDTIRVVQRSSPTFSAVRVPTPLTIRKNNPQGILHLIPGDFEPNRQIVPTCSRNEIRQLNCAGSESNTVSNPRSIEKYRNHDNFFGISNDKGKTLRKKSSWFKRKPTDDEDAMSIFGTETLASRNSNTEITRPPYERPSNPEPTSPSLTVVVKKKVGFGLGRLFKKRSSKPDMTVCEDCNDFDEESTLRDSMSEDGRARKIAPQQNWLAKLFHVKPAAKFICFSVSKKKARQEMVALLREWKRYGIRDIQVDKKRNVAFAKVGAQNYLDIKQVTFAAEFMTVIEHGKRSQLGVARLTQEKGAASSFQKVVETLEAVLKVRKLLVADERKKRMMIKTIKSLIATPP